MSQHSDNYEGEGAMFKNQNMLSKFKYIYDFISDGVFEPELNRIYYGHGWKDYVAKQKNIDCNWQSLS